MLRAVTFDLWNTLIVERFYTGERIRVIQRALAAEGAERGTAEVQAAYDAATRLHERAWTDEHRHLPLGDRFDYLLAQLGAPLSPGGRVEAIEELKEVFLLEPPGFREGVKETLRALHPRLRLGLISDTGISTGSVVRRFLDREGVLGFFGSLVFSDETGVAKPDPSAFRKALSELGVGAAEAIHVGDLPRTDVAGAKRVGMKAVWVYRPDREEEPEKPDYVIHEIPELLAVPEIRAALSA